MFFLQPIWKSIFVIRIFRLIIIKQKSFHAFLFHITFCHHCRSNHRTSCLWSVLISIFILVPSRFLWLTWRFCCRSGFRRLLFSGRCLFFSPRSSLFSWLFWAPFILWTLWEHWTIVICFIIA